MVTNLQAHSPSGSLSHQHLMITPEQDLTCVICSNHPLAHCLVRDAVCASTDLNARIETYVASGRLPNNGKLPILVLDTCSVQDWATHLKKWKVAGGIIIALISSEPMSTDLEMRILHLGVAGILSFSENLRDLLPKAIHVVARGQVWIRREVLDAYINRTHLAFHNLYVADQKLTIREKQIFELLRQDFSNRVIAQRLSVSERTIKFHVSNVLRKLHVASRKDLQSLEPTSISALGIMPQSTQGSVFKPRLDIV